MAAKTALLVFLAPKLAGGHGHNVWLSGLLALAAVNKLRFIPALRSGDPIAASHLSKSIYVEWLVILAILGVSAVLTTNLTLPK